MRSDDEVLELGAVSNTLLSEEVSEDGDDDIVGPVSGALDDSVSEEEDDSDILEAVGGEEEGNSVPFDDISELGLGLLGIALVEHLLSLFEEGEEFNLEGEVVLGLEGLELGIDLGLEEVEDVGNAVVLTGNLLVFLKGVHGQEGNQEAGENNKIGRAHV